MWITGLRFSMIKNLDCEESWLKTMTMPAQRKRDISISGSVMFSDLDGNICGLMDSITCYRLQIDCMALDSYETFILAEMLSRRVIYLEVGEYGDF